MRNFVKSFALILALSFALTADSFAALRILKAYSRTSRTAGETLAVGDLVSINNSNAAMKASNATESTRPAVGICNTAASSGETVEIVLSALVGGATSLDPGNAVYLSTGGGVTATRPTWVQQVGTATSSTDFIFLPSPEESKRILYTTFQTAPQCVQPDGTACSGTDTETNIINVGDNVFFEQTNIGTQTLTNPTLAAGGLLASLDLTNDEGVEYTNGLTTRSKAAFTIGTSPAFYLKFAATVADVSGSDILAAGFRKAGQAVQAAFADYTDKATLNKANGDIKIVTALNNGSDTTTDTTDNWADGETHTFEIYVSSAGVVTYKIDGVAPTTTAAFTFDSGDVVVPFVQILHDATTPGAIHFTKWEVGIQ